MKLRILRHDHPGIPGWVLSRMTSILLGDTQRREGDMETEAEIGVMQPQAMLAAPRNYKAWKGVSPRASRGSTDMPTP